MNSASAVKQLLGRGDYESVNEVYTSVVYTPIPVSFDC